MIDKDNEINLEDLEEVTGGTMPFSHNGIRMGGFPPKETVLNSMENNVIKQNNPAKVGYVKDFTANAVPLDEAICPNCKIELRHDPEGKRVYCTNCLYSKDVNY